MRRWAIGVSAGFALACGGGGFDAPPVAAPPPPPAKPAGPDLTGISGTWCYLDKFCYTYEGDNITEEGSGLKGKWRQEGNLYISQFGNDAPWVATIDMYTATQLVVTPLDDNERIVYSKRN